MSTGAWIGIGALGLLLVVVVYDLTQKKHAILRNFPVIGHFRYLLEAVGPELRQYIVTSNDEERPFSRDQRRWIYASSKRENDYFGFGTDNDLERPGYILFRHSAFPIHTPHAGEPGYDPALPARAGARAGRLPRAQARVPAGLDREHVGDELRLAVDRRPSRRSTAASRSPARCRTPARAASRITTAAAAS